VGELTCVYDNPRYGFLPNPYNPYFNSPRMPEFPMPRAIVRWFEDTYGKYRRNGVTKQGVVSGEVGWFAIRVDKDVNVVRGWTHVYPVVPMDEYGNWQRDRQQWDTLRSQLRFHDLTGLIHGALPTDIIYLTYWERLKYDGLVVVDAKQFGNRHYMFGVHDLFTGTALFEYGFAHSLCHDNRRLMSGAAL